MTKVRLSQQRLLTIVNERKKLRNEYRKHLEDEFIAGKKAEELEEFKIEREARRERGESVSMTPDEVIDMLKGRSIRKNEQLAKHKERLMTAMEGTEEVATSTLAPMMNEDDAELLATTKVKLNQKDILRMFVGNWTDLSLKQRRSVMGLIQAQRSKHAKQIFLKELATVGRRLNKFGGEEAAMPNHRIQGKKDPLKLQLE